MEQRVYTTHLQELTQGYDFPWQESAKEVLSLQVALQKKKNHARCLMRCMRS